MAHNAQTKHKVRAKYVQGLSLAAAAAAYGVPHATARNWKRKAVDEGDDWDVARNAKRMTRGGIEDLTGQILFELSVQFEATLKAMQDAKDMAPLQKAEILLKLGDAFVKTMAAAGRGNPKLGRLSVAMEVLRELAAYIAERHPKLRGQFIDIAEAFGPTLTAKFGS